MNENTQNQFTSEAIAKHRYSLPKEICEMYHDAHFPTNYTWSIIDLDLENTIISFTDSSFYVWKPVYPVQIVKHYVSHVSRNRAILLHQNHAAGLLCIRTNGTVVFIPNIMISKSIEVAVLNDSQVIGMYLVNPAVAQIVLSNGIIGEFNSITGSYTSKSMKSFLSNLFFSRLHLSASDADYIYRKGDFVIASYGDKIAKFDSNFNFQSEILLSSCMVLDITSYLNTLYIVTSSESDLISCHQLSFDPFEIKQSIDDVCCASSFISSVPITENEVICFTHRVAIFVNFSLNLKSPINIVKKGDYAIGFSSNDEYTYFHTMKDGISSLELTPKTSFAEEENLIEHLARAADLFDQTHQIPNDELPLFNLPLDKLANIEFKLLLSQENKGREHLAKIHKKVIRVVREMFQIDQLSSFKVNGFKIEMVPDQINEFGVPATISSFELVKKRIEDNDLTIVPILSKMLVNAAQNAKPKKVGNMFIEYPETVNLYLKFIKETLNKSVKIDDKVRLIEAYLLLNNRKVACETDISHVIEQGAQSQIRDLAARQKIYGLIGIVIQKSHQFKLIDNTPKEADPEIIQYLEEHNCDTEIRYLVALYPERFAMLSDRRVCFAPDNAENKQWLQDGDDKHAMSVRVFALMCSLLKSKHESEAIRSHITEALEKAEQIEHNFN